jgi:hypothetical protein
MSDLEGLINELYDEFHSFREVSSNRAKALSPEIWGLIADYYEDLGKSHLSQTIHWMIANKKRPYLMKEDGCYSWITNSSNHSAPSYLEMPTNKKQPFCSFEQCLEWLYEVLVAAKLL